MKTVFNNFKNRTLILSLLLLVTTIGLAQERPTIDERLIPDNPLIPIDGGMTTYYRDADGDTWGNANVTTQAFVRPNGYVSRSGDCDDSRSTVYPRQYYLDNDGDNAGSNQSIWYCGTNVPANYVTNNTDCNDNNAAINPGTRWYLDTDLDNYGGSTTFIGCTPPGGSPLSGYYRLVGGDCKDTNAAIYPGAVEVCDGVDNDCDGSIDENKPATPAAASVTNNCGNSTLTRSNPPSGITWYWQSSSGGTSTSNSSVNIIRTSGSVYYLRARNSTGCWSNARAVNYSIKVIPTVPAAPTISNQCGKSILTRSNPPSGITWYWQSTSGGTSTSNASASVTRTSGSVYYLRARNNSTGCWSGARTVSYSIKVIPGVPAAPSVVNNCGNSRLTRSNPPSGITWYWQSTSGGTSTSNANTSITRTSGSTYYLRARNNSSGCWSTARTVNYSIKAVPGAPSAPSVTNNCGNSVLTRSNPTSGTTWYWQSTSGGTSTSNSSVSITRTSGSTYYLRARNNSTGCWSTARTVSYSIKAVPIQPGTVTVTNNCGSSTLKRGNPISGITWYWQSSSGGTSTSNSSTTITRTSGSTYYLRARNNSNGCWGPARTVNYSIKVIPGVPATASVTNNCGNSVLTRSNPPSGITWYWQSSTGGTSTSNANASITRTSGSSYYLRARNNSNGCWSTARTVNYSIKVVPGVPATPTITNNCGNTVLTRSNPASGITWYWQSSSGGTSTSNSSVSITRTSGTAYYLRARNNGTGCWGSSRTVSYSINPVPTWYKDIDGDGFATTKVTQCASPGSGYVQTVLPLTDCNDNNSAIHPNTLWYADSDGDGFGDPNTSKTQCTQPAGYVNNNGDQCVDEAGTMSGCEGALYNDISLTSQENYVFTRTYQTEMSSPTQIKHEKDVIEAVSYFDGLGRTKQQVAIKAGGTSSIVGGTNELTVDWTAGQGSTGFFNRNGRAQENNRINGPDPSGKLSLLWHCGNDVNSDADGGWNTDYINVDKNVGYRYTVWIKRTGSKNGNSYHGTQNVNNLDGTANNNPYFWVSDPPQLDTWYLLVGVIHPYQYSGSNSGVSGVYDINGNKVMNGNDFKWRSNTTNSRFRSYLYYSTNTNTNQYFWNPIVQKLDGNETSIENIIAGPQGKAKDIVVHMEYDDYGRQTKQYLPFASDGTPGSYNTVNVTNDINSYYLNEYQEDFPGITNPALINAYSETIIEPSPLNRTLEQGAPGEAWKANPNSNTDHTIKFDWDSNTNADAVFHFRVNFTDPNNTEAPSLEKVGSYPIGKLYKTITKDENWKPGDGNNHTFEEFKDKLGQVILKRTYNNNDPHDTYYVYDDFGNLTYVIPPKVTTDNGVSQSELVELCYQYKYDYRNRLVEKKIPGKGWEYIVYNKLDKPVLSQDEYQRSRRQWLFTKYDAFGRVTYTGLHVHPSVISRNDMQTLANNTSSYSQYETKRSTSHIVAGTPIYYSNDAIPNGISKIYTVSYYDDYEIGDQVTFNPANGSGTWEGMSATAAVQGLPTVSRVSVLGTDKWITTATYYDPKGRPWESHVKNEYLDTEDWSLSKLDFTGRVLKTQTSHTKGNNSPITTIDTFTYDDMGRLIDQTQKINNQASEKIVSNSYDVLGQLETKEVGSGLQQIDYDYNIRGWLTEINKVDNLGNDLFAFGISYNTPKIQGVGVPGLYNGNISETTWKTANDNKKRAYGYLYDELNRITVSRFTDNMSAYTGQYNSAYSYDKNGNLLSLARNTTDGSGGYRQIDNLSYSYSNNNLGNSLTSVTDSASVQEGFKDGNTQGPDYNYDSNGNMIVDRNKNITSILYNHLNLPLTIEFNGANDGEILYTYDAHGAKLKKLTAKGNDVTITEYAGNYIYENGDLKFFGHTEGYVEPNSSNSFDYVYHHKDHLGNIRLSYSDKNKNGVIAIDEILEEHNYYPYGLKHKGYNEVISPFVNSVAKKFKYNGIELNESFGLDLYEMDVRQYDPAIARWTSIDPVTHYSASTYNAFDNNPVYWADPAGANSASSIQEMWDQTPENGRSVWSPDGNGGYTDDAIEGQQRSRKVEHINPLDGMVGVNVVKEIYHSGGVNGSKAGWYSLSAYAHIIKPVAYEIALRIYGWNSRYGIASMQMEGVLDSFIENNTFVDGYFAFLLSYGDSLKRADEARANYMASGHAKPMGIDSPFFMGAFSVARKFLGFTTASATSTLPTQIHHFATNKNKVWTPMMEKIAGRFGLGLDDAWNKMALPHLGRHPNEYHKFVYDGMVRAAAGAGGNQAKFIQLFQSYVKNPVIKNPQLLRKAGWQ